MISLAKIYLPKPIIYRHGRESHDNTEPRVQRLVMSHIWKRIWSRKARLERGFVLIISQIFMPILILVAIVVYIAVRGWEKDKAKQADIRFERAWNRTEKQLGKLPDDPDMLKSWYDELDKNIIFEKQIDDANK